MRLIQRGAKKRGKYFEEEDVPLFKELVLKPCYLCTTGPNKVGTHLKVACCLLAVGRSATLLLLLCPSAGQAAGSLLHRCRLPCTPDACAVSDSASSLVMYGSFLHLMLT